MSKLAAEVTAIESDLAGLATTRETLTKIFDDEVTAPSRPSIASPTG